MVVVFKIVDEGRRAKFIKTMLNSGVHYIDNPREVIAFSGLTEVCGFSKVSENKNSKFQWTTSGGNTIIFEPTFGNIIRIIYTGKEKGLKKMGEWLNIERSHLVSERRLDTRIMGWKANFA